MATVRRPAADLGSDVRRPPPYRSGQAGAGPHLGGSGQPCSQATRCSCWLTVSVPSSRSISDHCSASASPRRKPRARASVQRTELWVPTAARSRAAISSRESWGLLRPGDEDLPVSLSCECHLPLPKAPRYVSGLANWCSMAGGFLSCCQPTGARPGNFDWCGRHSMDGKVRRSSS